MVVYCTAMHSRGGWTNPSSNGEINHFYHNFINDFCHKATDCIFISVVRESCHVGPFWWLREIRAEFREAFRCESVETSLHLQRENWTSSRWFSIGKTLKEITLSSFLLKSKRSKKNDIQLYLIKADNLKVRTKALFYTLFA